MSIYYNFSERITVTQKHDREFKNLVIDRYEKIFENEETEIHILILNDKNYFKDSEKFLKDLEEAEDYTLEAHFDYVWRASCSNILFDIADNLEKADDDFLKSHKYVLYNYADESTTGDGILASYKNENGVAFRGTAPFEYINPDEIHRSWKNESVIVNSESRDYTEEEFDEIYPYLEKAKEFFDIDIDMDNKNFSVECIKHDSTLNIKAAMQALFEIEKRFFSELKTVENKFVSCYIEMLNVIFNFEDDSITYKIAR